MDKSMSLSINYKELVIISFNHLHRKTCYVKLDCKCMNIYISNFHLNPVIAIKIMSYVCGTVTNNIPIACGQFKLKTLGSYICVCNSVTLP